MKRLIALGVVTAIALGLVVAAPAQPPPADAAPDEIQDVVLLADPSPLLVRFHVRVEGTPLHAAWDGSMRRIFKALDRDKSGILTGAEVARIPPPNLLFSTGSLESPAKALLRTLSDTSGVQSKPPVSPDELAKYLRNQGGRPFHVFSSARAVSPVIWDSFSSDLLILGGRRGGGAPTDVNDVLFGLLDSDRDGRLSPRELEAGIKILAKYDKDEDEMIVQDELMPRNPNPWIYLETGGSYLSVPQAPTLLFALNGSGQLPDQLLRRYGPAGVPPTKLSRQQIGLSADAFARLDTDHDGYLDALELSRFSLRPPDLEFRVRLGRGFAPTFELITKAGSGVADQIARERQGLFSLQRGPTRLIFGPDSDNARGQGLLANYKNQFRGADQDANGYLDKKEAMQTPVFNLLFKEMDKDGDGQLFENEMLEYLTPWADLHDRAEESCASLSATEEGRGLFDLLDANRDGRLGVREIRQLPKLIERFDFNKDGHLQKEEFPRTFRILMRQGVQRGYNAGSYEAVVFTLDGAALPARLPELKDGPLWFRKMDRNRDGDLSRAEFLGSDQEFRRIDADADGLIGLEEAQRFDAQLRRAKK